MAKIPKNRADSEMFAGYKEHVTFENAALDEEPAAARPARKQARPDLAAELLTPELQQKIGRALLELKLELYKQGIVDYKIKVSAGQGKVELAAVPVKPGKNK